RRLIWRYADGDRVAHGAWHDGQIVDAHDQPLDLSKTARVSLWHPVSSDASATLAWRNWLERHEITQPFKQAHREVYLLTDAERQTRLYSNRFASHIVRQHQFAALCRERGWQFNLMGQWDSYNTPYVDLPEYNL